VAPQRSGYHGVMEFRTLGTEGLEVSAIGLGTMGMTMGDGDGDGDGDESGGVETIRRAHDLGVTLSAAATRRR